MIIFIIIRRKRKALFSKERIEDKSSMSHKTTPSPSLNYKMGQKHKKLKINS